jgi:hypothetical protein
MSHRTVIKQHVFNGHKYTSNLANASININAACIFPPIPKIYIPGLVHFPVYPDRKVDVYLMSNFEPKYVINLCPRLKLFWAH